jgi:DinB superfamily
MTRSSPQYNPMTSRVTDSIAASTYRLLLEVAVKRFSTVLLTAVVALAPVASAQTTTGISDKERAALVEYLTAMRDQVVSESATLTEAQWNFKAAPERWSVGEVVQHLALAESFIFGMQQKLVSGPPATAEQLAAAKGKDEMIRKVIPDRTKKAQAPEPLQPGTAPSLGGQAAVVAAFKDRRTATIEYAGKTKDDLRARVADSPIGPLDGYQWLLFIAAHSERHLAQLREVKADAKFPKAGAD